MCTASRKASRAACTPTPSAAYWRSSTRLVDWFSRTYQVLLKWSLRHRVLTLLIALSTFIAGLALPASGLIGTEFVPKADYSETGVNFYTPVGSSLELTESKVHQVEAVLREFPEVQVHLCHRQYRQCAGQELRDRLRAPDRRAPSASAATTQMTAAAARAAVAASPASP